ncbi:uncharacterized protein BDV17DRAFT_292530 [Aspergillus undulatus]|uniref:uncharacterized protein n=1 Tax=Aspergillus undulatus TaxID=1810928 RepID=UPI003CCDE8D2
MASDGGPSYCNICGGPLNSLNLRRASMAAKSDSRTRLWDDVCDCRDYFELDSDFDEEDDPGGMDPAYHDSECATQFGYISWDLPEGDVKWLDGVVLIGMKKPGQRGYPISEGEWSVFVTKTGKYSDTRGLKFNGFAAAHSNPSADGFLVHDACFQILRTSAPADQPLRLETLFDTMKASPKEEGINMIDWKDPRSYGGSDEWQTRAGWRAQAGAEWLVTNPLKQIKFRQFINHATRAKVIKQGSPIWGPEKSRTRPQDCFGGFPLEIRHMILELLPSTSVINLSIASPSFNTTARSLPNGFWKSRLEHHRWIRGTEIPQMLARVPEHHPINYYDLIDSLDKASKPPPDGLFLRPSQPKWFALKNNRRIWNCCQAIHDRIRARDAQVLVNNAGRVFKRDFLSHVQTTNTVYVSLQTQLHFIRAFYPRGEQEPFGGLLFQFADQSQQYVGDPRNHESVCSEKPEHRIHFDTSKSEKIVRITIDTPKSGNSAYKVMQVNMVLIIFFPPDLFRLHFRVDYTTYLFASPSSAPVQCQKHTNGICPSSPPISNTS